MKLPRTLNFVKLATINDYAWYYLYHAPRYAIDKRYRKRIENLEEMLREAYKSSVQGRG